MHGFLNLNQTNLLVFNLTKMSLFTLCQQKRTNVSLIVLILMTLFISACSTQPTIKKKDSSSNITTKEVSVVKIAKEKLALAQSLNSQLPNDEQARLTQQLLIDQLLIEASELYLQQQNFSKALWLANEIAEIKQENHQNTYRLLLVKASSLFALNYHQQAQQQLQLANELVAYTNTNTNTNKTNATPALTLTLDYYLVLHKVLAAQKQPVLALWAQLNAFALNPHSSNEDSQAIWHKLETLTQWQIAQLVNSEPPFIKGWAQLLNYSHRFGANSEQFSRYLHLWQQHNPTHPAITIIAQLQADMSSENLSTHLSKNKPANKIENIAILLPLSGSQQNAGLAAQQGILAAYKNNTTRNIYFIDTNKLDWEGIAAHFSALNIDHIIGPLLKPDVEIFLTLSAQQTALQVPTLLLNLPLQQPLATYQAALSMRPEDEAVQAAATLSQQNYKKPIVLSHNDWVSKRIAITFSHQWQLSTGNTVDIVYFDQGQQMQTSLKDSLDVNVSQSRIKQLNSRLKHNIKSEPRNRRDIDMIYLVGSAAQTRLIKPYIDVNISPFAEIIPIYASSRSHSNFNDKNNASSTNDLHGLTFTQIPWLLDSKQQDKTLHKLSNTLWPKRTDSLSRIFAMGFDSYHLLGKVSLMRKAPYLRHFGQTGVLKLNPNNILTRSLIWGQYKNDKVMQIAMD